LYGRTPLNAPEPPGWLRVACGAAFIATAMLAFVDYDARYRIAFELTLVPLSAIGLMSLVRPLRTTNVTRSYAT
jgi:hypothetical protein